MSIVPQITLGYRMKFRCNTCKIDTNHELKAFHQSHSAEDFDEEGQPGFWDTTEYRFWVCLGCDTATLEELWAPMNQVNYGTSVFYPKRVGGERPAKEFRQLDKKLNSIYREVITSFNAGIKVICAMGLRSLLEGICVNRGITDKEARGLEGKLRLLEEDKHLPAHIVECLYSFKFIGDSAAHRLEAPSAEELELAIDVMEDLLNFLYEMEYQLAFKARKLAEKRAAELEESKRRRASKVKPKRTPILSK